MQRPRWLGNVDMTPYSTEYGILATYMESCSRDISGRKKEMSTLYFFSLTAVILHEWEIVL